MIASPVLLGPLRQQSVRVGRTTYRFCFAPGIPDSEIVQIVTIYGRVARYLRAVFRRDLGPDYRTLVLPSASSGDEFDGGSWATGQGGTLYPPTTGRVHRFAERLIGGYLLEPGYRSVITQRTEYWLADGILGLYSWRAVAHAGLIPDMDLDRELGAAYLSAVVARRGTTDLEAAYDRGAPDEIVRSVLAPTAALVIDRALRRSGHSSLDGLVGEVYRAPRAGSFWDAVGRVLGKPEARDLRVRFVRGRELLPVERLHESRPTTPAPPPPRRTPVRTFVLAYTGNSYGFLENCGCKVNQSGGLARRATILKKLRGAPAPVFLLDAGNSFRRPEDGERLDYMARQEQRLYVHVMDQIGYDAAAVGATELARGVRFFKDMTDGARTPFLLANSTYRGAPIAPSMRLIERGGIRIGVVGALEPPRGLESNRLFEINTIDVAIDDPVPALARCSELLKPRCDIVVALGRFSAPMVRRIAEGCPQVDVVVSDLFAFPHPSGPGPGAKVEQNDRSGFLGRTLVLYTLPGKYGISTAWIGLDSTDGVASAQIVDRWLGSGVRDDVRVRATLTRFYDEVGRRSAAIASVEPLFAWDVRRQGGAYVGADRCTKCHEDEETQWRTTAHAQAYHTLLEAHRHFQPRCVVCHVVGFRRRSGYKIGAPTEALAGVQCEVCHGPGAAHVAAPTARNIEGAVPERICVECHTPDHSDHFVYDQKLPKVRHGPGLN